MTMQAKQFTVSKPLFVSSELPPFWVKKYPNGHTVVVFESEKNLLFFNNASPLFNQERYDVLADGVVHVHVGLLH